MEKLAGNSQTAPGSGPFNIAQDKLQKIFLRPDLSIENRQSKIQNCVIASLLTPYRITRSALASTFDGIVTPICLAVLRLITNSNFVGCSTGRSAGLVPLRILSTKTAARRYGRFG